MTKTENREPDTANAHPTFSLELLRFYERHLRDEVMPFWTERCIDWECGGILNVISDDGVRESTDKYLWSQGRALWTFSALYNDFDGDDEWHRIADNLAAFIMTHGRDNDGAWAFCLHRDGSVAVPPQSIYVDAFIIHGLTEYARATGNEQALELAVDTFRRTSPLLDDHATLPTQPHQIPPGLQAHGPSMIMAHAYHELGLLTRNDEILARALDLAETVMREHVKPDQRVLLEFVKPGGALAPGAEGQTFLPGHAIESMWFLERIFRHHDRADRIALAMQVIHWNMDKGWDPDFDGIFLAGHNGGGTPAWRQHDTKLWWAHVEALYALMRASVVTGDAWCEAWFQRVHDYSFRVFPNRDQGDWYQNLDRQGRRIPVVVRNLAVKDPFHLPRGLLMCILELRALTAPCSSGLLRSKR